MPKKICIITISLAKGGAERSTALLSKMLADKGFDVHLVSLTSQIDYEYKGSLFCLYQKNKNNLFLFRFFRFLNYLRKEKFDLVIDNRTRFSNFKEFIYHFVFYKNTQVVYVVHSFNIERYFPKSKLLSKLIIHRSKAIVCVSKAIAKEVNKKYNSKKAIHIYNSSELMNISFDVKKCEYIIFLGRIVESVKNLSLLIDSYSKSILPEKGIQLKVLGDGPDLKWLKSKVQKMNLTAQVDFIPYTIDVGSYLKNAKFQVLTSHYEGFPRVLIESLSMGTPVISVDCKSGPKEIIIHEYNGLLIENYNPDKLADAYNRFVTDPNLYETCKKNAKKSIKHLQPDAIAEKWKNLLIK